MSGDSLFVCMEAARAAGGQGTHRRHNAAVREKRFSGRAPQTVGIPSNTTVIPVQNCGYGVILANGVSILGEVNPPESRGRYVALYSAMIGVGQAVFPSAAG